MAQCNWSAENATKAYLRTLNMGKRASSHDQQPDASEFISAIAAGNNSQLMVLACAGGKPMGPTASAVLALLAAAHQTGGRVVCILPAKTLLSEHDQQQLPKELHEAILGHNAQLECVFGDAPILVASEYEGADFVAVGCNLENGHEKVLQAIMDKKKCNGKGVLVLGYNAFRAGSWRSGKTAMTQLLPIGEGLLITRVAGKGKEVVGGQGCSSGGGGSGGFGRKRSNWVVKVDEVTGEEHVFRVRSPHAKVVRA